MSQEPLVAQFTGALQEVIDRFRDQGLTVAEALGALYLLQLEIANGAMDDGEEDSP